MNDPELIQNLLIGAILPLVIAALTRVDWPAAWEALIALAACIVATIIVAFVRGDFDAGGDIVLTLASIWAAAFATYQALWRPTGVAPAIERAVPLTGQPRDASNGER